MPKSRKRKQPDYSFITIVVDEYSARADAGIHLDLLGTTRYVRNDEEPAYRFETSLVLTGLCSYPEDRIGHRYDISLIGDSTGCDFPLRINDLHERDKNGLPRYRTFRGGQYPVYATPPPLAYTEKIRGENRWAIWLRVAPRMVSDALVMLSGNNQVYVSLHEVKENRQRRVHSLSIQTTDPEEE